MRQLSIGRDLRPLTMTPRDDQGRGQAILCQGDLDLQLQVEVQLTVVDRDGNTIWKGLASGEATRFGRSYKIENYYEVLSDAVVNTVSSMLRSAEFRRSCRAAEVAARGREGGCRHESLRPLAFHDTLARHPHLR